MRLIFIRHGDPDYSIDSLTEKGWREAKALSDRVSKWKDITEIYVSPLGRAKDTASFSLEKLGRTAIEEPWLKEFWIPTVHPEDGKVHVPWDFYPSFWTPDSRFYERDQWFKPDIISSVKAPEGYEEKLKKHGFENKDNIYIEEEYKKVITGFDAVMAKHGYTRYGGYYKTDGSGKDDTIVFFCHLGVSLLIIGYLLGISPFVMWHACFVAPTSVTILNSEEREEGNAWFRIQTLGSTTHLHDAGEPVSAAGAFSDVFQD